MIDERIRILVERYVSGVLNEEECSRLESMADRDAELTAYIESQLSGQMEAVRQAIAMPELPDSALERVRSISKRRSVSWWWFGGALPAAAVIVLFLVLDRAPTLRLESAVGQVWANGKQIKVGDDVPASSKIFCVNPAQFAFGGTSMPAMGAMTVFEFTRGAEKPVFHPLAGELVFSENRVQTPYLVAAGDWVANPLGTRFSASADGGTDSNLSVYQASVELSHNGKPTVLTAGQSAENGSGGSFVENDPVAALERDVLVPTASGLATMSILPYRFVSERAEKEIAAVLSSPSQAQPEARLAVIMARDELRAAASNAARMALATDPSLTALSKSDLWTLLRSQATAIGDSDRGDPVIAQTCLRLLVARGEATSNYAQTWRNLLDLLLDKSEGDQVSDLSIIEAATELLRFHVAEDRLTVAEALESAGQNPPNREALAQSERILKVLASEAAKTQDSRLIALLDHHLGEAIYFQGRKRESVNWTIAAAKAWPRPHWLVHAGARIAETNSAPYEESLKWIQAGLRQDPSWPSYERAMVAMEMYVLTPKQRELELEFVRWVAEKFSSVLIAQEELVGWAANNFDDAALTEKLLKRCIDLRGDVRKVNPSTLVTLSIFFHRHGDLERQKDLAAPIVEGPPSAEQISYYRYTDDPPNALSVLNKLPKKYEYMTLDRAQLQNEVGQKEPARGNVTQFLGEQQAFFANHGYYKEPLLVVEGLLLASELAQTEALRTDLARQALLILDAPSETSQAAQMNAQIIRAQALGQLGRKQEAIALLKKLQGMALVPDKMKRVNELLARIQR